MQSVDPSDLRRTIRRRALANLIIVLMDQAQRAGGRFTVRAVARDAVRLDYRGVRTLTRRHGVFSLAARDFVVLLVCPERWPFERAAALVPFVLAPDDFHHPNSDGHGLCLDLEGVLPERLPAILYDNIRVGRFRLDHVVDAPAADFVRAHLEAFPADPRPLHLSRDNGSPFLGPSPGGADEGAMSMGSESVRFAERALWHPGGDGGGGEETLIGVAGRDPFTALRAAAAEVPAVDVTVGVLGVALPALSRPTFLRLGRPASPLVDRARAAYLGEAGAHLRAARPAWVHGPGLAVRPSAAPAQLAAEVREVGRALDALGDERIARSYLQLGALHDEEPNTCPARS
jgi:hypothetical protein